MLLGSRVGFFFLCLRLLLHRLFRHLNGLGLYFAGHPLYVLVHFGLESFEHDCVIVVPPVVADPDRLL